MMIYCDSMKGNVEHFDVFNRRKNRSSFLRFGSNKKWVIGLQYSIYKFYKIRRFKNCTRVGSLHNSHLLLPDARKPVKGNPVKVILPDHTLVEQ